MRTRSCIACFIALLAAELAALIVFAVYTPNVSQDAVAVNKAVQSASEDWQDIEDHKKVDGINYCIIDLDGHVLFCSANGLSTTINDAIVHGDTVLDIEVGGEEVGKLIVYDDTQEKLIKQKRGVVIALALLIGLQCVAAIVYLLYVDRAVIRPFKRMKGFAERVACGNLDIPLVMDKNNVFGAFTESFDIMRDELKKARIAEAKANESKKELVAKLSHDVKTPVASIMAVSEVGLATATTKKIKQSFSQIMIKAEQINALISDLFSATLEELQQLTVTPVELSSDVLKGILVSADYRKRTVLPDMPECLIWADKLRLQQVFDNIFANSYKYADTDISTSACLSGDMLYVTVEDHGGGVPQAELPCLTEKYKRGSNAKDKDGAGLGLYISKMFMEQMNGNLAVEMGKDGLSVTVGICLAGKN